MFYANKFKEGQEVCDVLDSLVSKSGTPYPDSDRAFPRKAIERALDFVPHSGRPMPFRICRYPLETNTLEYVVTGHETPTSIFSGYLSESQQKELDEYEPENLQDKYNKYKQLHAKAAGKINLAPPVYHSYSFFFGGVGDARHVLASLHDLSHSLKPQRQLTTFRFTLVEVKAVAVARALVLFYLLRHLATFPPKNITKNINAIEIIALLQYMGVASPVMPSYLYARMIVTIREIRKDLANKSLPSFLSVSLSSVPEIIHILDSWIDFKVTTQEMYDRTVGIQPPEREGETQQQRLDKMTDQDLAKFKIEGLSTLHEIRDALRLSCEFMEFDDSEQYLMGTSTEYTLYGHTKVLSPPHLLLKKHPVFQQYYKMHTNIRERRFAAGDTTFAFKQVIKDVIDNWRPNVTMWDQPWVKLNDQIGGLKFSHNPFFEAANLFLPLSHPAKPCSVFDYAIDFFVPAASCISRMEHDPQFKIFLEFIVGETFSVAFGLSHSPGKEARTEKKLPCTFDRILLSNIPENNGGNLSVSTFIMPLLRPLSHASVSFSVFNNHLFESTDEWLKSNTLLTRDGNQNYLGMKYLNGDLYEQLIWAPITPAVGKLATQDDLTLWLYKIFLFIVLPPHSESHPVAGRVDYPLNLVAFVHLLVRLIAIGYPSHWVGIVLDSLLSGKIKTKARPPPESLKANIPLATISTKPFLADLEAAVLSNEQYLPFKLYSSHLPHPLHKIILDVQVSAGGDMSAPVFALLFGSLDDLMSMKANDLRHSLLNNNKTNNNNNNNNNNTEEEPNIIIYSNVRWISATKEVELWIDEHRLNRMITNDWHVAPIRVDLWIPLSLPVPIKPK